MPGQPQQPDHRPDDAETPDERPRLQKVLAAAGLGSRRQCEELILEGRVEIDHQVENRLGTRVDPHRQEIRVDGVALPRPRLVYYLVNKPPGVVSTSSDPAGRPRVIDLVPERDRRLFAVGRLDMSSEGLILVTNDGELANQLTHPRYGVEKTYDVEVAGRIERADVARLVRGVHLAEGRARAQSAEIKKVRPKSTLLEIVLAEGRNREIRRMLARAGHKVLRLRRVALGPLRLGELPRGQCRTLDERELRALRQAARGLADRRGRKRFGKPGGPRRPEMGRGKPSGEVPRTIIGGETSKPSKQPGRPPRTNGARPARPRPARPRTRAGRPR
jgi:23S rRNA pseudouridine2605 synthase